MHTPQFSEEQIPAKMKALVLTQPHLPLLLCDVPGPEEVLVKVIACGVCRTDLHIMDGELYEAKFPLIPGHEIIGQVVSCGSLTRKLKSGMFIGIAWLAHACGICPYCIEGKENLCEGALFTGYTKDGGFAEYTVAFENLFALNFTNIRYVRKMRHCFVPGLSVTDLTGCCRKQRIQSGFTDLAQQHIF